MHTHCPSCKCTAEKYFSVPDINQRISDQIFDYYRCTVCGLIFLSPIPMNLQDFYGSAYSAYQHPKIVTMQDVSAHDISKIKVVKKYAQGEKLLEIGPGYGAFSFVAKHEGFVVDAIEMDSNCCEYLKETIGIRHVVNSIDIPLGINQMECKYDVVVMWHVLEHLNNPLEVLQAIFSVLSPSGIVVVATPNPNATQFKLFERYWKHVDAPRHLMLIPANLLVHKMELFGFKNLLLTTKDEVSSIFDTYGWWLTSLENYQSENPKSIICKLGIDSRIRKSMTFFIYKYFFGILEKIDGHGSAYLAIFKKSDSNN